MPVFEIPLSASPQSMTIALGAAVYTLRFFYADTPEGGWAMDISDATGNPILCGVPLVTGADLLAQYAYLGIGGKLWVRTDGNAGAVPTFANLGTQSHLYFETA